MAVWFYAIGFVIHTIRAVGLAFDLPDSDSRWHRANLNAAFAVVCLTLATGWPFN
jgi:hypothetical protein